MKSATVFVLSLALALTAAAQAPKPSPSPSPAAGPRIAVEPESFDFGSVVQNKTLTKEFSIRNFGTADLVIEGVSTTCGCTAALPESRTIKPGGSTQLRVTLETRSYSGAIQRLVLIRSNDAVKALYDLKLLATVQPASPAPPK